MSRDAANEWLKKNDPLYGQRKKIEHPYLNGRQMNERMKREIPISNLSATKILTRIGMSEEEALLIKDYMD